MNNHTDDLKPYRCSFTAENTRQVWIRFARDMELAFSQFKEVVLREYPDAKSFMIESSQDDPAIFEQWRRWRRQGNNKRKAEQMSYRKRNPSAECECTYNFTCGYCLRNAPPWHFTPSTVTEQAARKPESFLEGRADEHYRETGKMPGEP